jgi:hypothetical protein
VLDTEAFYNATNLVCRIPFLFVQQLEGINLSTLSLATTQVVKMKANTADAPYVIQKGAPTHWQFNLTYATVDQFLVMAHEQLAASRLPYADRKEALQVHTTAQCKSCQLREQTLYSKIQFMSTLDFSKKDVAMPPCFSNRAI